VQNPSLHHGIRVRLSGNGLEVLGVSVTIRAEVEVKLLPTSVSRIVNSDPDKT